MPLCGEFLAAAGTAPPTSGAQPGRSTGPPHRRLRPLASVAVFSWMKYAPETRFL
ncbi:MAG: hypothetical protein KME26_13610 [Oscillatoria princeps RMCB-10]|nr:hypothetical protein [Oscillatoria princeps RMCB-10]